MYEWLFILARVSLKMNDDLDETKVPFLQVNEYCDSVPAKMSRDFKLSFPLGMFMHNFSLVVCNAKCYYARI